jgi:hypothetical protein
MVDVIGQLRLDREETISCLRRGEFGYANEVIKRLVDYMQPEFRAQVVGQFNACNYIRVADLLEHLWTHVELPEDEAAKPAQEAKDLVGVGV